MTDATPALGQGEQHLWLEQLYGTAEDGWLSFFALDRRDGRRRTDWAHVDDLREVEAIVARREPHCCMWFGVATRAERLTDGARGKAEDCVAIPGLWLDVDIEGPGHRSTNRLAADQAAAVALVRRFPLPPTAVVHTGGGLQAWWLFPELVDLDDDTRTLLAAWGATWARLGREAGIDLDNVFDPARVMRLPGTTNRKEGLARPVRIVHAEWRRRYGLDDLDQHLDDAPAPPEHRTGGRQGVPYIGPERPGDAYTVRHSGGELLAAHGFTLARTDRNGDEHWVRPGKHQRDGTSATVYADDGHTTIWSDTVIGQHPSMEVRRPYDVFGLYTHLEHGGDWRAATAALRQAGYGEPPTRLADLTKQQPGADDHPPEPVAEPDDPWEPPVPLPQRIAPVSWPDDILPPWMDDHARAAAASINLEVDVTAMLAIAALSIATFGHLRVDNGAGYVQDVNLYLVVALPPTEGKTPAIEAMIDPLREWEAERMALRAKARAEAETDLDVLAKKAKDATEGAARTGMDADLLDAKTARAAIAETELPATGQVFVGRTTPERLAELLSECDERIAVVSDEGGVLDVDAYRDRSKASNLDLWLQAWSGHPHQPESRSGLRVRLKHPLICLAVATQPEEWDRIMSDPALRSRGFPQRIMASVPTPRAGTRNKDPRLRRRDGDAAAAYRRRITELAREYDSFGFPVTVRISDAALDVWVEWANVLERRIGLDLADEAGWVGKMMDQATLRLAALLHVAWGHPTREEIGVDSMRRAIAVGDYWLAHRLAATVDLDLVRDARKLLGWALRQPEGRFTKTDLGRGGSKGLRSVDETAEALQLLHGHHWLRPVGEGLGVVPGATALARGADLWLVNPAAGGTPAASETCPKDVRTRPRISTLREVAEPATTESQQVAGVSDESVYRGSEPSSSSFSVPTPGSRPNDPRAPEDPPIGDSSTPPEATPTGAAPPVDNSPGPEPIPPELTGTIFDPHPPRTQEQQQ